MTQRKIPVVFDRVQKRGPFSGCSSQNDVRFQEKGPFSGSYVMIDVLLIVIIFIQTDFPIDFLLSRR